jgi:hypothetical protein
MCAAEGRSAYGTIIVVGGGCYGSYYVRQLHRAARAGALHWERLLVVDRDANCAVARSLQAPETEDRDFDVVVSDWDEFFAGYLGSAAESPAAFAGDAIVPSPLMPHLMSDWLMLRARQRWPEWEVGPRPLPALPPVPWERAGADGSAHYVSFAEWMCPTNCVEPRLCPATRGVRSWSLPVALREWMATEAEAGSRIRGPVLFHCSHRAYGVGMLETREIVEADELISAAGAEGPFEVLVGTVSHCHGALTLLSAGSPTAGPGTQVIP